MFTRETCLCKGLVRSCNSSSFKRNMNHLTHFTSINLSETYGKEYILTFNQITNNMSETYVLFGCSPIKMF